MRKNSEISCQWIKNKEENEKLKVKGTTLHRNRMKLCVLFNKMQYM